MAATKTVQGTNIAQHIVAHPGPYLTRVRGVMDLDRSAELTATHLTGIEVARTKGPGDLLVDLTHSSFCDSSGLSVLLRARPAASDQGITVRLASPSHQTLPLLELTDTTSLAGAVDLPSAAPGSPV